MHAVERDAKRHVRLGLLELEVVIDRKHFLRCVDIEDGSEITSATVERVAIQPIKVMISMSFHTTRARSWF